MQKSTAITIRYDTNHIKFLKEEARRVSYQQDKDVRYTDLIREAIVCKYPNLKATSDERET